jgi:hypothetical protein
MKLLKFREMVERDLNEFTLQWALAHAKTPDKYPICMNERDWYKEFINHVQ